MRRYVHRTLRARGGDGRIARRVRGSNRPLCPHPRRWCIRGLHRALRDPEAGMGFQDSSCGFNQRIWSQVWSLLRRCWLGRVALEAILAEGPDL